MEEWNDAGHDALKKYGQIVDIKLTRNRVVAQFEHGAAFSGD